jgi:Na+:H+ antiporter, NhaB family
MRPEAHDPPAGPPWLGLFLGHAPQWYKYTILVFLAVNAVAALVIPVMVPDHAEAIRFAVGWAILIEFIVTLAMALQCYPLLPGGLLALEAIVLRLCTPDGVYHEAERNFPVILLLIFVVAGVNFLKDWLSAAFTALLFSTRSKIALSLVFCGTAALLSAFLDALTVTAVIIAVCKGFYDVYNDYRSRAGISDDAELEQFRAFLRSLVMHAVVGTALGGVMTLVGEPQNLLIAHMMESHLDPARAAHWGFVGFMLKMAPITAPTFMAGLMTTVLCERFRWLGYGATMPERVRQTLTENATQVRRGRSAQDRFRLVVQALCAALLVIALAFHWAEVGIIGLFLIVLATAFGGISDEHRIGHAFTESMPFTALLVVFLAIVAMIAEQQLFRPVIDLALRREASGQLIAFFWANALLSSVSDNVFVATVFINEATAAFTDGTIGADQYERLAIATNVGTNIPSVATPNGQAAFLFLLTSALARPIRLGYVTMLRMALPYTVMLTAVSFVMLLLVL